MALRGHNQRMKMEEAKSTVESVTALGFGTRKGVCIWPRRGTTDCETPPGVST